MDSDKIMNISKKLSQGMLTRRTSQQTLLEHFNRMAMKDDFERFIVIVIGGSIRNVLHFLEYEISGLQLVNQRD